MYYYHKISESLSEKIDLSRAFAALLVMLVHLRATFFVQYSDLIPASQNIWNYFMFFITRIGHECVIVFFVLSGFLVGGNYLSDFINQKHDARKYLINRFSRMWVVLIPALILGYVLCTISFQISKNNYFLNEINWKTFFGNLFFLQNVFVRTFGGNSPLWSLTNEFWYYILWPVLLHFLFSSGNRIIKVCVLLLILFVFIWIAPDIMLLFIIWILGALIRFVPKLEMLQKKIVFYFAFLLFAASVVYSNMHNSIFSDFFVGFSFSLLLIFWMYSETRLYSTIQKYISKLAACSFSIYAIHYSFLFIVSWLFQKVFLLDIRLKEASLINWLYYAIAASLMLLICWLFYNITEKYTYNVRNKLIKIIIRNKRM